MTGEDAVKLAGTVAESLKTQPLALALVIVNVLFLVFGAWVLHTVGVHVRAERATQTAVLKECLERK